MQRGANVNGRGAEESQGAGAKRAVRAGAFSYLHSAGVCVPQKLGWRGGWKMSEASQGGRRDSAALGGAWEAQLVGVGAKASWADGKSGQRGRGTGWRACVHS
jgi:hypothetical protein